MPHAMRSSVSTISVLALTLGLATLVWWKTGQPSKSELAATGTRYAAKADMEKVSDDFYEKGYQNTESIG